MKAAKKSASCLIRLIISLAFLFGGHRAFAQSDFWQATNGPSGDPAKSIVINTSVHIFTGTEGGGVFRSTDNGDNWTAVNSGLSNLLIESFIINSSGHLFVGTDDGGVFRSINNGDSWTARNSGLTNLVVGSLAINSSGHVFAGTDGGGVFRSINNGDSWTARNSGLSNRIVISLAINASGHIFAGTEGGGVFRSTNNGDNWTARISGLANLVVESIAINASGHIFVGTDGGGIFRSINNGDSWTPVNTGLTDLTVVDFAINTNGDIFAGTLGGGAFRSTTNGDSWTAVNSGLTNLIINALTLNAGGFIFAGTGGGVVFRSTASTVAPAAPSTPTLASPANGAMNQPTTLTLSWDPAASAATYRLHVSTSSDFSTAIVDDSTIASTSRQIGPLANKTTYFWRVNAKNAGGTSAYSEARSFTTIVAAPPAPTLASPANDAANQPTTLSLNWNPAADAEAYHLQVSTSSDFSTVIVDDSTIASTSRQIGPLANNTAYHWRVRAKNIAGPSTYSEVRRFTTIVQLPSQVLLTTPPPDAVIEADSVQFSWQQSLPAVNRHWFELATDSLMINPAIDSTLTATDTTKLIHRLLNNQTYWWRVRAANAAGWGPFSEQRRFRIYIETSIETVGELPADFSLSQNYPNPFNPSTTIAYALPQPSRVALKVYNVLGKEIRTLVDGKQPAGRHRVQLDGNGLPSGMYFYRIQAGDFVQTKKFTLLK